MGQKQVAIKSWQGFWCKVGCQDIEFYLDLIKSKAHERRSQLIEKNEQITAQSIKDFLSGAAQRKKMFMSIFAEHNANVKALPYPTECLPNFKVPIYRGF